jgi:hypothetical protein
MILTTVSRNAMCNALVDLVDAGTGDGYLAFETSGDVEVATLPFGATAFGNAATGVATANAITSDTNATGGTVAQASVFDGDDQKLWENTVSTSGAEINLSSLAVGAADTVLMSAFTVTVPAS